MKDTLRQIEVGTGRCHGLDARAEQKEIALAAAGQQAAGVLGKIVVSIAAAFSAASAINATLLATARLTRRIASEGELPGSLREENRHGVPQRAVTVLGTLGTAVAAIGSLGGLVAAASLTFLVTFAGVNYLAATGSHGNGFLPAIGAPSAGAAGLVAAWRLATQQPANLVALGVVAVAAVTIRPLVRGRVST